MLRSIYRVASSGSPSKDAFSTLFHAGQLKVVRCTDDNSLECFELEVRGGSSIALTSRVVPLGHAGLEEEPVLFAVHCFTQRLASGQPLPVMGVLAATEEAHFSLRVFGGRLRDEGSLSDMAADCQTLALDFVPSLLKSLLLPGPVAERGFLPAAFLVSGSCRELRVLAQRGLSGMFEWLPDTSGIPTLPPSFAACRTQALCADVRHVPGLGVVAAFGCEDGCVLLTVGGVERQRVHLEGPVSSVCLFSPAPRGAGRSPRQELWAARPLLSWAAPDDPPPGPQWDWEGLATASPRSSAAAAALARLKAEAATAASAATAAGPAELHLACGGAAGFVVLFENVGVDALGRCAVLAAAEDAVLSMAAGDWDADGCEELLVGTHGGRLLAFGRQSGQWALESAMEFGPPVHSFHALRRVDVVPYVLCGTPASLEVLGPPLKTLERILQQRLEELARRYAE